MLQIYNYKAGKGDCMRLRFESHNIFIDSGVIGFGTKLAQICKEIEQAGEVIDAFILTHVDVDHIGGLLYNLRLHNPLPIQEVWMNHGRFISGSIDLSVRQNDEVYSLLTKQGIPVLPACAGVEYNIGSAAFRILAPNKSTLVQMFPRRQETMLRVQSDYGYSLEELSRKILTVKDTSINNKASVVFEFLYEDQRMLFSGDAWAEDIVGVTTGFYDLIKLPHHGSARNISEEWHTIPCKNFLICTDGVNHPDKQTIAKLLHWNKDVHFYGSTAWWNKMLHENEKEYESCFEEGEEFVWPIQKKN